MKIITIFVLSFLVSSNTFAANKQCLKTCKADYVECKIEVDDWVEGEYQVLEGSQYYLSDESLNTILKKVDSEKKNMTKLCKEDFNKCKVSCDAN